MSRVVVVGAGIVGLCAARELAQRGHDVVVLEQAPRDHRGCSWGNLGMIVPSHFQPLAAPGMVGYGLRMLASPKSPFGFHMPPSAAFASWAWRFWRSSTRAHVERASPIVARLHLASRALHEQWARELGGDLGFAAEGLLTLCETTPRLEEEARLAERARSYGLEVDVLDQAGLREREPGVEIAAVGAVHYRDDAHLEPGLLIEALARDLESRGVEIRWSSAATEVVAPGGRVEAVATTEGQVEAEWVVLAGGVVAGTLARPLGASLPMVGGKGYTMTVPNPPQLLKACAILAEARIAATPMRGAFRIGGTMEMGAPDLSVSEKRVQGIREGFGRVFPAFTDAVFDGVPVWSGLRPLSPDGLPYLGALPQAPQCLVAAGHAMMGLSLGPITGRCVAQLVDREPTDVPLELFRPDRFS